jgi:hypothetical protein
MREVDAMNQSHHHKNIWTDILGEKEIVYDS